MLVVGAMRAVNASADSIALLSGLVVCCRGNALYGGDAVMPVTDPPKDWTLERTGARVAERMLRAKYGADLWGDINVGHIDTGVQRHQIFGDWVMIDRGVNYMESGQPPIDPLKSASFGGH